MIADGNATLSAAPALRIGYRRPPPVEPVERRARLGAAEFRERYLLPRQPVVFTDLAEAWPIYTRATPEHFRSRYGTHPVRVLGRECPLAELLDRLENSTPAKPAPYPCKYEIAKEFRALLPEVSPRFPHSLPDRQGSMLIPPSLFEYINNLEIFFGGPGGKFPYLHYDVMHLHAWITQLHGDKEFTLYAPGQEAFLYVNPQVPWQSLIRNHHNPDPLRYPLFRNAMAQRIVLHAGETLFLPCGWWHTARSLNTTISVAFDQLGPDNWSDFVADVVDERNRSGKRVAAVALGSWLNALGGTLAALERFSANRFGADQNWHWGRR